MTTTTPTMQPRYKIIGQERPGFIQVQDTNTSIQFVVYFQDLLKRRDLMNGLNDGDGFIIGRLVAKHV